MINPVLAKPWIKTAVLAVSYAAAFGGGWLIADWRTGAEVEKLSGDNRMLEAVRGKCETDVKNIRLAMQAIEAEAEERVRQAEEAMKQIEPEVRERTVTITKIKELPVVALDHQCEAIKQEQIDYVVMRRGT